MTCDAIIGATRSVASPYEPLLPEEPAPPDVPVPDEPDDDCPDVPLDPDDVPLDPLDAVPDVPPDEPDDDPAPDDDPLDPLDAVPDVPLDPDDAVPDDELDGAWPFGLAHMAQAVRVHGLNDTPVAVTVHPVGVEGPWPGEICDETMEKAPLVNGLMVPPPPVVNSPYAQ